MDDSNKKLSPYFCALLVAVIIFALYFIRDKMYVISNLFSTAYINIQKETTPTTSFSPTPLPNLQPGTFQISLKDITEPFVVNEIEFKISSAKNLGGDLSAYSILNSGYGGVYPKTQGKYIEVRISAKNIGTVNTSLSNVFFALRDSLGRRYTTDNQIIFVNIPDYELINSFNDSFGVLIIKPGFSKNYVFITDVAKDSTGLSIVIANQKDQNYYIPLAL